MERTTDNTRNELARFTLEIDQETTIRFCERCAQRGATPEEVLEGFINDLVCGKRTRGSDERDLAEQYFDRCIPGFAEPAFAAHVLTFYGHETAEALATGEEDIKEYYEEYTENRRNPESMEEARESIKAYIDSVKKITG